MRVKILRREDIPDGEVHVLVNIGKIAKGNNLDVEEVRKLVSEIDRMFENKQVLFFSVKGRIRRYYVLENRRKGTFFWEGNVRVSMYDIIVEIKKRKRIKGELAELLKLVRESMRKFFVLVKL